MDKSLSGSSKQITRVIAPLAVAVTGMLFGGCNAQRNSIDQYTPVDNSGAIRTNSDDIMRRGFLNTPGVPVDATSNPNSAAIVKQINQSLDLALPGKVMAGIIAIEADDPFKQLLADSRGQFMGLQNILLRQSDENGVYYTLIKKHTFDQSAKEIVRDYKPTVSQKVVMWAQQNGSFFQELDSTNATIFAGPVRDGILTLPVTFQSVANGPVTPGTPIILQVRQSTFNGMYDSVNLATQTAVEHVVTSERITSYLQPGGFRGGGAGDLPYGLLQSVYEGNFRRRTGQASPIQRLPDRGQNR